MLRPSLLGTIVIALSVMGRFSFAQTGESSPQFAGQAASQSTAAAAAQAAPAASSLPTIAANSKITAVLESSIDTRLAKPGDELSARVMKDVKHDGKVVIHKGDRLLGKVVAAEAKGAHSTGSRLSAKFDRLESGGTITELQTVVTSVFNSSTAIGEQPAGMPSPAPMAMPGSQAGGASASGGGLLGGVGSTVGSTLSAVGSAGSAAGGVLNSSADSTLGSSADVAAVASGRGIRVESQSGASLSGGMNSIFSAPQGDFRLNSGTNLQFRVLEQADKPTREESQ